MIKIQNELQRFEHSNFEFRVSDLKAPSGNFKRMFEFSALFIIMTYLTDMTVPLVIILSSSGVNLKTA